MTQTETQSGFEQRLVLAHSDIGFAALASRQFHRLGWDVYLAKSGAEARRLAKTINPAVVVLDTNLTDESGWLTCEKLNREQPGPKVVLVGETLTAELSNFATFVGAASLVSRKEGVTTLVSEVLGASVAAAG